MTWRAWNAFVALWGLVLAGWACWDHSVVALLCGVFLYVIGSLTLAAGEKR